MTLTAHALPSGCIHIRGRGPCNWAQVPCWPCGDDTLAAGTFEEASMEFRVALHEARDAAMSTDMEAPK